jgi:pentatricopeptide repeat protein
VASPSLAAAGRRPVDSAGGGPEEIDRRRFRFAAALLAAVVCLAYVPSLFCSYVRLDDFQYVVDNPVVRHPSWAGVVRFFSEVTRPSTVAGYYQPLTMVSFMLDAIVSGGDGVHPVVCHAQSVALHALTSVLLMLLVRRITGGVWIPALLAGMYALHPMQAESVSWISQRKTVLATPLAVGSLLCYVQYASTGRPGRLAASAALYGLANLAKPTVVLMPLVLPLLDAWPLGRPIRRNLVEKLPFAALMAVFGWIAYVSQSRSDAHLSLPNLGSGDLVARWAYLLSYNAMLYAGNIVLPLWLSPFRAMPERLSLAEPAISLSVAGTAALLVAWATSWRWSRAVFVGLAGFGLTLSPALGPLRYVASCVADRFLYFPSVFLLLPAAAAARRLAPAAGRHRGLTALCLGLWGASMVALLLGQQSVWRDSKTLWTHVLEAVPDDGTAHSHLALIYLQEEELDRALYHAERGRALAPEEPDALHLLGRAYVRHGRVAEALGLIREALERGLGPSQAAGYVSLAEAHVAEGDLPAAEAACERAIGLGRKGGECYAILGDAAMRFARRPDVAERYFQEAIRRDPANEDLRLAVEQLRLRLQRTGEQGGE